MVSPQLYSRYSPVGVNVFLSCNGNHLELDTHLLRCNPEKASVLVFQKHQNEALENMTKINDTFDDTNLLGKLYCSVAVEMDMYQMMMHCLVSLVQ